MKTNSLLSIFALISISLFTACQSPTVAGDQTARSLASGEVTDKSGYTYDPNDRSCDGYPRLKVGTMPGTCLGLVLPRDRATDSKAKRGFEKPRTIVQIPKSQDFLVVDMGGWAANNGSLFLLQNNQGRYDLKLVKYPFDNPHGLAWGPDGLLYIGEKEKIVRYRYVNGQLTNPQVVVGNILKEKGYMHPLTQFTFDPNTGDLFVNIGSASDHCRVDGKKDYKYCAENAERGTGAIVRIPAAEIKNLGPGGVRAFEATALGLRNSMAIAIHEPSGTVVQGENSRDFPEFDEPYEEMNVILKNKLGSYYTLHYGWPYCYDYRATSPEWLFPENAKAPLKQQFTKPIYCNAGENPSGGSSGYMPPHSLIPPHAAPLHAAYYTKGSMFRDVLGGKLIMSWHGYQPTGHRLVAYDVDEKGRPLRVDVAGQTFNVDQDRGCPRPRAWQPRGGIKKISPYKEIISNWNEVKGARPKGAPVGFTFAEDGSIWIVEDNANRTIVRLAKDERTIQDPCVANGKTADDPKIKLLVWRNFLKTNPTFDKEYKNIHANLVTKYCLGCHGNFEEGTANKDIYTPLDYFVRNQWLVPKDLERSKLYGAIAHVNGLPPMPPIDKAQFIGTNEGSQLISQVQNYIQALPNDFEARVKRINIDQAKKIRLRPTIQGDPCGQFEANDIAYVDPRPSTQVAADGWIWSKVYLVQNSTRLFINKCAWPQDGVFYYASRKQ